MGKGLWDWEINALEWSDFQYFILLLYRVDDHHRILMAFNFYHF